MLGFDIAPFALPNHPDNELRFEEPRDICRVVVAFADVAPADVQLHYLRRGWPADRIENAATMASDRPARLGWLSIDDHTNSEWSPAAVEIERLDEERLQVTFVGVGDELPDFDDADYSVSFRRTMGIRLDAGDAEIVRLEVYTVSPRVRSRLRVEMLTDKWSPDGTVGYSFYNAGLGEIEPADGLPGAIEMEILHMHPAHPYCYDDGLVTFDLGDEAFTISLTALEQEGPIWYPEEGVYICHAADPTTAADYQARVEGDQTVAAQVMAHAEQTFAGARSGQPRPHADGFCIGCKRSRQQFFINPNGDIVTMKRQVSAVPGRDTPRYRNEGNARFFFGLERWCVISRANDPPPVLAYNIELRQGDLTLAQKLFAVPLSRPPGSLQTGDETVVGMVRFRFVNTGVRPVAAELPVGYSSKSNRNHAPDTIPDSPRDRLTVQNGRLTSEWQEQDELRAVVTTSMATKARGDDIVFSQVLGPGETCELILKVPYVAVDEVELGALEALDFDTCFRQVAEFWRREGARGASVATPEPHLNAAWLLHLPIVQISDFAMPDGSGLVNTSVGTATYGNFCNEACMIQRELDVRGLPDEARRRLGIYVKYQGQTEMLGNYSDFNGLYFGTGGYEGGRAYNQNHGWVMWRLADHYFMTNDQDWLATVAPSLIEAADWVFRQRRATMAELPHSHGWERGFLPAGGLEDVADFHYWLVNNVMAWRGCDWTARALAEIEHPEAARLRQETDDYRTDLLRGFETARRHSPLVRLRDGRWVPHYPSRLYRRGRDVGWIREVLEGSVYLLLAGLYDPNGKEAQWILDDYQDNRYMSPPYGYIVEDPEQNWFARGGFSIQPNLLAGLMPYLDRDEPEVYIWMFFNAWAACYREEINAIVEHPMPVLGFSNAVPFKTSDQANAMTWLVHMFVYTMGETLHLGRAVPRYWLAGEQETGAVGVATCFGGVGVRFRAEKGNRRISAEVTLDLRRQPESISLRFRHPGRTPIREVLVNGEPHNEFDPAGDVDLSGLSGVVNVVAAY